jgi:energy-coupling factor transporter ATP-binding protein EcfA2
MSVDIQVNNVGAVVEFEYSLNGPGLHVLLGHQGAGKSTVLRTVELAVDGRCDVKPPKRDGSARGEAYVAGHTLRINKQTRVEGELTIEGLGDLSIADLHSPQFRDAATRDRHRIKSLVRIAGVKADASLFHYLLGDEERFNSIVPVDSLKTDDLVEMSARVKRAIDAEAQRIEKRRDTEQANARAQAAIAEGVDTTTEHDEQILQDALEREMERHAKAKAERDAVAKRANDVTATTSRAQEARERLEQIGGGQTASEAQAKFDVEASNIKAIDEQIARLLAKVSEAQHARNEVAAKYTAAKEALAAARREETLHTELMAAIDAAKDLTAPTEDEKLEAAEAVERAEVRVEAAKAAITKGATTRAALAAKEASERHQDRADEFATQARRLRGAATDTLEVLTKSIATIEGCPLSVRQSEDGDPRLVIATDRSEFEYYDELSDGERWQVVVGIAAGSNKLIVLPQAAYGELAPSTRLQLHRLAQRNGCYILTALADDCELHGVSYTELVDSRSAAE